LADCYAGHSDAGNCRLQWGLGNLGVDFVGYGNTLSNSFRPSLSDAFGWTFSKYECLFEPENKDCGHL
jgi:hypothetical protein